MPRTATEPATTVTTARVGGKATITVKRDTIAKAEAVGEWFADAFEDLHGIRPVQDLDSVVAMSVNKAYELMLAAKARVEGEPASDAATE